MKQRAIATVGMFDGVHSGHRLLIDTLTKESNKRNLSSVILTFNQHPFSRIQPDKVPKMLLSADEKRQRLMQSGVDKVVMLDFDNKLQSLTAQQFMMMLKNKYDADVLIMGFNNRFGSDKPSDFNIYREIGLTLGIEVLKGPECPNVSSSIIRNHIFSKSITEANKALGYNYHITGHVVKGKQLGRTIGFPTANIVNDDSSILIPPNGVYAALVTLPDGDKKGAMVNIGHRPTVDNHNAPLSIEANIFDCNSNLYDSKLTVEFIDFMRDEKKFNGIEELITQIEKDRCKALDIINSLQAH